jgi:hypothetical protein
MDLLDMAGGVERREQGRWLHKLNVETKKLQGLTQEVSQHYHASLSALKSVAHVYENINTLLISVSRSFAEVGVGSRIGVGTNVARLTNLVTTIAESPQGRDVRRFLKDQMQDAEDLKTRVKRSLTALKKRDQQYSVLASARSSAAHRRRQLDAEVKLGKEVRDIYAATSRLVDKECIGLVRSYTNGASAVIQLAQDRYTRRLLAATDAVGTLNGYPATGVVQHPAPASRVLPMPRSSPASAQARGGDYGLNHNDYVSLVESGLPVAMQPTSPTLLQHSRQVDTGVALQFAH